MEDEVIRGLMIAAEKPPSSGYVLSAPHLWPEESVVLVPWPHEPQLPHYTPSPSIAPLTRSSHFPDPNPSVPDAEWPPVVQVPIRACMLASKTSGISGFPGYDTVAEHHFGLAAGPAQTLCPLPVTSFSQSPYLPLSWPLAQSPLLK